MRNKDCAYESEDPKWKERVETLTRDLSERDDLFSPFPVLVTTINKLCSSFRCPGLHLLYYAKHELVMSCCRYCCASAEICPPLEMNFAGCRSMLMRVAACHQASCALKRHQGRQNLLHIA